MRVLTLIGGAGLLVRRLTNPRIRATSSGADILILAILLIQCILGLTTIPFSAQHPDGSEMMKLVAGRKALSLSRAVHLRILMVSPLYSAFIWCLE